MAKWTQQFLWWSLLLLVMEMKLDAKLSMLVLDRYENASFEWFDVWFKVLGYRQTCLFTRSVTLRWEKLDTVGVALKTLRHSSAALGDNIYVYGGILDGTPTDDLMMFNTGQQHVDRWDSDQMYGLVLGHAVVYELQSNCRICFFKSQQVCSNNMFYQGLNTSILYIF